ncbi:hypothetical protein CXF72_02000 [Psychromonas sp. MB-3u-54]|nr:hypothetical protein CXF72_02000 [Psychromonas sp. MB-3u-54]
MRVHPFDAKHNKARVGVDKMLFLSGTIEKMHIPTINVILIRYTALIALNYYLQKRESNRTQHRANSTILTVR